MGLNINLNRGSMNTATFAASRYHLIANVIVLITNHWRKYISKSLQNIPTPDEMYAFMITVKLCVGYDEYDINKNTNYFSMSAHKQVLSVINNTDQ